MKVNLKNFRCFKGEYSFEFQKGRICLLKGPSGAGKSTLLESIRWCLFGNLRNIYPHGFTPTPTNKTFVEVVINDLKIIRTQAPEQLKVMVQNTELTQDAAQSYVDNVFGNRNVWLASSFIHQNERCPLMIASNTERMTLLNELLFGNDNSTPYENPDFYIERIEEEIGKISQEITSQTAVFNTYYNKYMSVYNSFQNIYGWDNMTPSMIEEYERSIITLKTQIQELTTQIFTTSAHENRVTLLENRLQSLSQRTPIDESIVSTNKTVLEANKTKLTKLRSDLNLATFNQSRFVSLSEDLQKLLSTFKSEFILHNLQELETAFCQNKNQIQQLERDYEKIQSNEVTMKNLEFQIRSLKEEFNTNDEMYSRVISRYFQVEPANPSEELKKILKNSQVYKELIQIKENLTSVLVPENDILSQKTMIQSQINDFTYTSNTVQRFGLPLDVKVIESKLEGAQKVIDFDQIQKVHLQNYQQFQEIQSQIDALTQGLVPIDLTFVGIDIDLSFEEIVEKLKSRIQDMTLKLGSPLKCPNCQCTLEMKNNALTIPSNEIIDQMEGMRIITQLRSLQMSVTNNNLSKMKIESLRSKLEMIPVFDVGIVQTPVRPINEITVLQTLIDSCKKTNLQALEYNVSELQKTLESLNLMEKYYVSIKMFDSSVQVEENLQSLQNDIATLPLVTLKRNKLQSDLQIADKRLEILLNESEILVKCDTEFIHSLKSKNETLNQLIRDVKEQKEIQSKIESINKSLETLVLMNIPELEENIHNLERENEQLQGIVLNSEQLLKEYQEYLSFNNELGLVRSLIITPSENLKTQLNASNQHLEQYTDMISKARSMLQLMNDRADLETHQSSVITSTNKQATLNNLKAAVVNVTNSTLQDLVDNINNTTNTILEDLFETSLVIELKLFKEMKTKQKIKPCVNLIVYYNGNIYEANSLSGGEKDRVSLAMTIALAMIHTSPVVFLDECMSSLNMDLREDCMEIIKKFLVEQNNKTVLNVEHMSIEGLYDDIVEVKV